MICPVCKSPMIVVEYQQIELDYCSNCSGVWFDCGELELMLEKENLAETGLGTDSSEVKTAEKKRKCPICGRKMRKNLIGKEPKIVIDACPQGEGLWFDGGEIDELLTQLATGKAESPGSEGRVLTFLKDVFQAHE